MFWQETGLPENTRQAAYNVHLFHLLDEPGWALTLAGLKISDRKLARPGLKSNGP